MELFNQRIKLDCFGLTGASWKKWPKKLAFISYKPGLYQGRKFFMEEITFKNLLEALNNAVGSWQGADPQLGQQNNIFYFQDKHFWKLKVNWQWPSLIKRKRHKEKINRKSIDLAKDPLLGSPWSSFLDCLFFSKDIPLMLTAGFIAIVLLVHTELFSVFIFVFH